MTTPVDNQTTHPTKTVRAIVRWVLRELDVDLPSAVVRVAHYTNQGAMGRFYPNCYRRRPRVWSRHSPGLEISDEAAHLVLTRIPLNPWPGRRMRGGPPFFIPKNWMESLVCITAHEATHLRQHLFPKPGAPRYSEIEAEWAEYRLLRRYRGRRN